MRYFRHKKIFYAICLYSGIYSYDRLFESTANPELSIEFFPIQRFLGLQRVSIRNNLVVANTRYEIMERIAQWCDNMGIDKSRLKKMPILGFKIINLIDKDIYLTGNDRSLVYMVAQNMIDGEFCFSKDIDRVIYLLKLTNVNISYTGDQLPCCYIDTDMNETSQIGFEQFRKKVDATLEYYAPQGGDLVYEARELFDPSEAQTMRLYRDLSLQAYTVLQPTTELIEYWLSKPEASSMVKVKIWATDYYKELQELPANLSQLMLARIVEGFNKGKAARYIETLWNLWNHKDYNTEESYANRINVALSLMNNLSSPRFLTLVHRSAVYVLCFACLSQLPLLLPPYFFSYVLYYLIYQCFHYYDYFAVNSNNYFENSTKHIVLFYVLFYYFMFSIFFQYIGFWKCLTVLKICLFLIFELMIPQALSFNLTIIDAWTAEQNNDFTSPVIYLFYELVFLKAASIIVILLQQIYIPFYIIFIINIFIMMLTPASELEIPKTLLKNA